MQPMTRAEFMIEIDQQVDQAIAEGMMAYGTDEFIEQSILDVLETTQLQENVSSLLCGLLVVFGMRRREFLAVHPAH